MYKIIQYICLLLVSFCLTSPINAQINDLCSGSKNLNFGTVLCDEKNIEAGPDVPNNCGFNNASVWYTFTTVTTGNYVIEISNATCNDVLTLYLGTCGNLIEIACTNDDQYGFVGERLVVPLSGNTDYYVMVSGADNTFGRTLGTFCVGVRKATTDDIPPPSIGDCSQATAVTFDNSGNPSTCIVGTNQHATLANPKPSCSPYAGPSTWYRLEAGSAGVLKMEYAPNFSQIISVYKGVCGNMEEIECSMNGESSSGEKLIVYLSDPNKLYYIQMSGNFNTIEADYSNTTLCNHSDYYVDMKLSSMCLAEYQGLPCNDNNSSTLNDIITANCECKGTCLLEGDRCDDGDPNTVGEVFDMDCNCVGQCGTQGTACNDSDPNTMNDSFDSNCNCIGTCTLSASSCPLGHILNSATCSCEPSCVINTPCDDNNIYTADGLWDEYCNCVAACQTSCEDENESGNGNYLPNEFCKCECFDFGKDCDDGDELTNNDSYDINCNCKGIPIEECNENILITNTDFAKTYFEASKSITTVKYNSGNGLLVVSTNLTLNAGMDITLNSGVTIQQGAIFHAYIEGCVQ